MSELVENSIVTDEVARSFSWFGQNANIQVKTFNNMNLIKGKYDYGTEIILALLKI